MEMNLHADTVSVKRHDGSRSPHILGLASGAQQPHANARNVEGQSV
eukprot:CAMPEP_0115114178 /NCGR_PEP_ID=MMETSP0227-20121206/41905_1 /TAXON_ID=89957 /ORGANISM="Polarella glacialis, Strain CCMP 1383" /LENGTH=45 /DNA_ID= /DNA_START= /DNA_END= /DNA_ORIENTATION=